jgi:hypothetical protein
MPTAKVTKVWEKTDMINLDILTQQDLRGTEKKT